MKLSQFKFKLPETQVALEPPHLAFENEDGTLDARAYSPYGGYQPIGKTWEEVERYVGAFLGRKRKLCERR